MTRGAEKPEPEKEERVVESLWPWKTPEEFNAAHEAWKAEQAAVEQREEAKQPPLAHPTRPVPPPLPPRAPPTQPPLPPRMPTRPTPPAVPRPPNAPQPVWSTCIHCGQTLRTVVGAKRFCRMMCMAGYEEEHRRRVLVQPPPLSNVREGEERLFPCAWCGNRSGTPPRVRGIYCCENCEASAKEFINRPNVFTAIGNDVKNT